MWVWVCIVAAMVMLLCGWLMPIHLRGVDLSIIQAAGKNSPTPQSQSAIPTPVGMGSERLTPFLISAENRNKALDYLGRSSSPTVQALLRCRQATNTILFPPSSSASGQAFDTAVAIWGLLLDGDHLTPSLAAAISARANAGAHGGDTGPLEAVLMDGLSLGERFAWRRLVIFTERIKDPSTLTVLTAAVRETNSQLPVVYSAVELSRRPDDVARYLSSFSLTGVRDLAAAEKWGAGAVNELLQRHQELFRSAARERLASHAPFNTFFRAASEYAFRLPQVALALKWFFYLSGGLLLALALQLAVPPPLGETSNLLLARELLFALGVLLVALLLSEPFLAQGSQKGNMPFRLHLSAVGSAVASQATQAKSSLMNSSNMTANLLTLLLFFILQALIFIACLARLAETMRQNVPARVKLKLLENEDHLFDAGLYLGFVGTIVCLILVSLGVLQFSLMAAYSSTSFGIIFVSILKIFKVRPARRILLLEAEGASPAPGVPPRASAPNFITAS